MGEEGAIERYGGKGEGRELLRGGEERSKPYQGVDSLVCEGVGHLDSIFFQPIEQRQYGTLLFANQSRVPEPVKNSARLSERAKWWSVNTAYIYITMRILVCNQPAAIPTSSIVGLRSSSPPTLLLTPLAPLARARNLSATGHTRPALSIACREVCVHGGWTGDGRQGPGQDSPAPSNPHLAVLCVLTSVLLTALGVL